MKLKKRLQVILCIMLIMPMNLTSESKNSKQNSENLQKESNKSFTTEEVEKLVEQISFEAEKKIEQAFDEGYKAAVVFYAPQIEIYENEIKNLETELKIEKRNKWLIPLCSMAGAGIGFGCGIIAVKVGN